MKKSLISLCGLALCATAPAFADTYSNGPFVTHPAGGFQGKDASALQTALSLNVFGFGHAQSAGIRVADDVEVPSGETWSVTGLSFFSYQTGMTTTATTFTNVSLGLWKTKPTGTANVPDLMAYTNFPINASNSKFTNCYRPLDTALATESARPIWKNTVTLASPVSLPAGTYWVDWQTAGTLASGPWCPPVTIKDAIQKPGSNALQFNAAVLGAWDPLVDNGATLSPQDLIFEIEYTKDGGCYPDCDGDGILSIDDFICFQTLFALGDPYADCDGDGALSIDDFICFQTLFAIGC